MPRLNVLRVVFMLSTIVFATDCCSSRILLFEEHTLKTVYEQRPQQPPSPKQQQKQQLAFEKPIRNVQKQLQVDFDVNTSRTLLADSHTATPTATQSSDFTVSSYETTTESSTESTEYAGTGTVPSTTIDYLDENMLVTTKLADPIGEPNRNGTSAVEIFRRTRDQLFGFFSDLYFYIVSYFFRLDCGEPFRTEFCLNHGRCFRVTFDNYSIFCCECPHGFVGERCDGKYIDGQYKPVKPVPLEQPKIRSARFSLNFPMLLILSAVYLICGLVVVFKCPSHKHRSYDLEQN